MLFIVIQGLDIINRNNLSIPSFTVAVFLFASVLGCVSLCQCVTYYMPFLVTEGNAKL